MTVASNRRHRSDEIDAESVLDALSNDATQQLLAHLDTPRTAQELARRSDVPLSTVYRTVERLVDAGLLRTRTEIRLDGNHPTRYELAFESVTISIDDEGGLDIEVVSSGRRLQPSHPSPPIETHQ